MNASSGTPGRQGIPFVVSAPSGTGKTTVCRAVVEADAGIEFSVSHTTRKMRPGEVNGEHYHFVDEAEFLALVDQDAFVEHAEYAGNRYGTSWRSIDEPLAAGRDLLLEVEVQGAAQLRARRADARFLFLLPPSREELERRLRGRGTDDDAAVRRRLAIVESELAAVHGFDYAIVNRDLDETIAAVREIIAAERAGQCAHARSAWGREHVVASFGEVLRIPPPLPSA